eukprot:6612965-Pyramimonas_sp.AAC.1
MARRRGCPPTSHRPSAGGDYQRAATRRCGRESFGGPGQKTSLCTALRCTLASPRCERSANLSACCSAGATGRC